MSRSSAYETLLPEAPGGAGPIDPAVISVGAAPEDLGCLFLIIATVYGSGGSLDEVGPLYELRPSPGVRVVVYAPGLESGAPSEDVRAWSRTHLVPYQG